MKNAYATQTHLEQINALPYEKNIKPSKIRYYLHLISTIHMVYEYDLFK